MSSRSVAGVLSKGPLRVNTRPSAYAIAKPFMRAKNIAWQRDLLEDSLVAAGYSGIVNGTKLYVSNLDVGVTNEDIKELFSEIGQLKRYTLHYDKNGRPSGSAEVVFVKSTDALAAMKRYNNVQLDGKFMKIEIIGTSSGVPVSARVNVTGRANGRGKRTVVMTSGFGQAKASVPLNPGSNRPIRGGFNRGRGRGLGGIRGGWGRGRGRGFGRGRGKKEAVDKSADELNKELENYMQES